jgi:PKD repeat protein
MSASFNIRCNHNLVQSSFPLFPCQINLSSILIDYPAIKALITAPSDINVYDISGAAYVPVYIDLNLTYDKLLVYFQGAINNLTDKIFRVTIGDVPSSNSYSVFSTYYDRHWGLNAVDNTITTDICLASGSVLNKNYVRFGYDSKFYKGSRNVGTGEYALVDHPSSLISATEFSIRIRWQKVDGSTTGNGYFYYFAPSITGIIYIYHRTANVLQLYMQRGYTIYWGAAEIDTSTWILGEYYDIVVNVKLNASIVSDKVKLYVNGNSVLASLAGNWDLINDTSAETGTALCLGATGGSSYNAGVIDMIAISSGNLDEDYILTSANQYLNNNFWTIIVKNVGDVSAFPSKTFVNHRVNFKSVFSSSSSFVWHFGDGTTSTKDTPWHTYTKAGIYTVILFVDDIECEDTCTIIVFESSFVMDAGAVYLNYGEKNQMLLGATEGGNLFGIDQDFRHMTFDTMKNSELAGSHRLTNSIPKIIANFIEINYRLLNIAMPGSDITFNSGSVTIKRAIRKLLNNDYVKNIAIVAEHGGTGCYIVFRILNAVTVENIEIPFEDSNESVIEVTFTGCFSESNYDDEPWQIDIITKD